MKDNVLTGKTNHFYLGSGTHNTIVVLTCPFIHYNIRRKRNILSPVNEPKKLLFISIEFVRDNYKKESVIGTCVCTQLIVEHDQNNTFKLARKGGITDKELVMTTTSMYARLTQEVIVKYPQEKKNRVFFSANKQLLRDAIR
jgi:hypothetical protein